MGSRVKGVMGMYLVELEVLISRPGHQMYRVAIVCTLPQYEALRCPPETYHCAPSQGPPGATIACMAGKSECSHSSFKGKQGTVAVPGLEPVTLQSTKYGIPLGYFIAFPTKVMRLVTGSFDEYRTSRRGTLKLAHLCSPIK